MHAWMRDPSHLHEFELADDRLIGFPNVDIDYAPGVVWLDTRAERAARAGRGEEFAYVFDSGDDSVTARACAPVSPAGSSRAVRIAAGWA